ncbi:MAG: DUF2164 domain-containing protein [Planctomycetota bacterium]|jgi:uncharacterized protein (DUF2164 family)
MSIEFSFESKKRIYESTRRYFREQFDEDIGLLQFERFFDFVVRSIGATIYNQAVSDAQAWLQRKVLDLEGDLHEEVEPG